MLRFALLCLALLAVITVPAQDEGFFIEFDKIDLEVNLLPDEQRIEVDATLMITNRTFYPLEVMDLYFNGEAEISGATVNGKKVTTENIGRRGAERRRLVFTFTEPISVEETFTVETQYSISYLGRGLGVGIEPGSTHILVAARWVPWLHLIDSDHGLDAAPARIMVTVPEGERVVMPGNRTDERVGEGLTTTIWETALCQHPVLVAGDYRVTHASDGPRTAEGYLFNDMDERAEHAMDTLLVKALDIYAYYESMLGPLPEAPLRIVAVNRPGGYGLPRCLLLNRETFDFDEEMDPDTFEFLSHEIAHSWFPGLVRPRGQGGGLMSEAMASWMAAMATEHFLGEAAALQVWKEYQVKYAALEVPVPLINAGFGSSAYGKSVYNRGAYWWRTMERQIGREDLMALLREFGETHTSRAMAFEELWGFIDENTEEDLSGLIRWTLREADLANVALRTDPVIRPIDGGHEVTLEIETSGHGALPLDIELALADGSVVRESWTLGDQVRRTVALRVSSEPVRITLDPDRWLIQSHYRDDQWPREINAMGHYQAAAAAWRRDSPEDGLEPIAQAIARQPRNPQFHLMAGLLLEATDDPSAARDHLNTALENADGSTDSVTKAWTLVALGRTCLALGDRDNASGYWTRVENTDETGSAFAQAQAALRRMDLELREDASE